MNRINKSLLLAFALLLPTVAAFSQDSLQSAFVNRRVWLKIDMPGSQLGVDVYPERSDALADNYANLLHQFPPAYRAGDSATVTKLVVKKDHIEFHLDHGGFGQFGDNSDITPVPFAPLPPSPDEIHLREKIDHEPDERDRRREQHILDDMVQQRAALDAQNKAAADAATQAKLQAVNDRRIHGGSRFNISYSGHVPEGLTPRDIEEALRPYVSFRPLGSGYPAGQPATPQSGQDYPPQGYAPQSAPPQGYTPNPAQRPAQPTAQDYYPQQQQQQQPTQGYYPSQPAQGGPPQTAPSTGSTQLQKGMTIAQVEQTLGPPTSTSSQDSQYGKSTTELFLIGNQVITVNYMDGVLTRYNMAARQ